MADRRQRRRAPAYDPHFYHHLNVVEASERFGPTNYLHMELPDGSLDVIYPHEKPAPSLLYVLRGLVEPYGPVPLVRLGGK